MNQRNLVVVHMTLDLDLVSLDEGSDLVALLNIDLDILEAGLVVEVVHSRQDLDYLGIDLVLVLVVPFVVDP